MAQTQWDTERVRQLLAKAREFTAANGGRILVAQLGVLLRKVDQEFEPGVLGDSKLVRLLRRYPDIGALKENISTGELEFQFHSAEEAQTQPLLPGTEPSALVERIDQKLWLGLVSERAPTLYLDLQTLALATEPEVAQRLEDEPERYLRIPSIPQDELRALAREYAAELQDHAAQERLIASLDKESWFREFTHLAEELRADKPWIERHRSHVIAYAKKWLEEHEIKAERFITARRIASPAREPVRPVTPVPQQPTLSPVRKLVHSAVDRMTEEELLNLTIPLRYLIRK